MSGNVNLYYSLKKNINVDVRFENADNVFIDWVGTNENQIAILDAMKRGLGIIVFDRYFLFDVSDSLFSKCVKYGVLFLEPSVINRPNFIYQPFWVDTTKLVKYYEQDMEEYFTRPNNDLVFIGKIKERVSCIEEIMIPAAEYGGHNLLVMPTDDPKDILLKSFKDSGISMGESGFNIDSTFGLVPSSPIENHLGRMDTSFEYYLSNKIVPLISRDNRWYSSFRDISVTSDDVLYFLRQNPVIRYGMLIDIITNIKKYHPEMDVDNLSTRIISYIK